MKKLFFFFSILIIGCSNQNDTVIEDISPIPPELIGKWKIIELYESESGINPVWRQVFTTNSYNYWFKINGEYIRDEGYIKGAFEINNDSLTFIVTSTQNSQTVLIEYLDSETLIINWLSFEPYKHKYIKVSSEEE